jgi:anti-anti-sigma factor
MSAGYFCTWIEGKNMATHIVQLKSVVVERFNGKQTGLRLRLHREPDHDDTIYFGLTGHLDGTNSAGFTSSVVEVIGMYPRLRIILFNLQSLNYIASSGIGAFVNILLHAKTSNLRMGLYGLGPNIRSVFELLGFIDFFSISESRDVALEAARASFPDSDNIPSCPACGEMILPDHGTGYRCPRCGSRFSVDQVASLHAPPGSAEDRHELR